MGFPGGSDGKESACSGKDLSSILGLGRAPGEGKGYPLQYSCLENSMDRGAWRATVHGVEKSWTWLSDFYYCLLLIIKSTVFWLLIILVTIKHRFTLLIKLVTIGVMGASQVVIVVPANAGDAFCLKIPCTEETGQLRSMGPQRVGHNWATEHTQTHRRYIYTEPISQGNTKWMKYSNIEDNSQRYRKSTGLCDNEGLSHAAVTNSLKKKEVIIKIVFHSYHKN